MFNLSCLKWASVTCFLAGGVKVDASATTNSEINEDEEDEDADGTGGDVKTNLRETLAQPLDADQLNRETCV